MAASAVIAAVTFTETQAGATPATSAPAPQQPPPASDALTKYRELATQASRANEDYLRAKENLDAKQNDLNKATADIDNAKRSETAALADQERYRVDVDRFANMSFVSGSEMNKMSALLSGTSAQDYLDRSSALDIIATDKNKALNGFNTAINQAREAQRLATDAQSRATTARDDAARLAADAEARKRTLDEQVAQAQAQSQRLNASDRAQQRDAGPDVGPVKAPTAAAQTAVNAALGKRGSAYVWGATGPSTFDCSGLTQWAYKQAGISLSRTTNSQIGEGRAVSKDQLQPGDLVFSSGVGHVGIYIGNGQMVHAPTSGDVVKVSPVRMEDGARRVAL